MDNVLKSAIARLKSKIDNSSTAISEKAFAGEQKVNYLIPIMQQQWASHCAYPSKVNVTMFTAYPEGGCQLLSNGHGDQLLLNIALDRPEDYKRLCKFKKHRFYNLFKGDNEIYELEFGGVTDAAIQITSEILTDVFDIPVDKEIATTFETWD